MPIEITGGKQIPSGTYTAILQSVESYTHATYGEGRKWNWLVDVNDEIVPITSITSGNAGPQSKAYAYLKALLKRDLQAGEKVEEPTGKRVTLQIAVGANGFSKVEQVLPFDEPQQTLPGVPR